VHGANEHVQPPVVEWMVGTKCVVHIERTNFCSTTRDASTPSVINMDDVMRARITSIARTQTGIWGNGRSRRDALGRERQDDAAPERCRSSTTADLGALD
jgi:hypothetical protein